MVYSLNKITQSNNFLKLSVIKKDPYDDPIWKLFMGIIGWTLWCLPFIWFLRVLAIEGK